MTYVTNIIKYSVLACLVGLALHLTSFYLINYPLVEGAVDLIIRGATIGVIWGIIQTRRDRKKEKQQAAQ
ncbi:hypothetical protein [Sinobaca sp. H24]|uniref:hypothetical protein n=1 Tax=Sinobaca sp. H24 TaxID=2923376 RepID=UPI00207A989C|nr:hypothetical protein [Sinobaca sp. H24]